MIRVLVVEDSTSTRELLVRLLDADGRFSVVGTAADGEEAVFLAAQLRPDVIVMDIHLPRLDGISATARIMAETPTPVVVVSLSVQKPEAVLAFEALQAGALTVLDKPPGPDHPRHQEAAQEFLTTVRLMSEVKVVRRRVPSSPSPSSFTRQVPAGRDEGGAGRPSVIAVAASTGGPEAIQVLLRSLGCDLDVPVLVVQHISPGFVESMVAWLGTTCPQVVKLARHGEELHGGTIYLGPDEHHLMVSRRGNIVLSKAPPVRQYRPSADMLFESVAEAYQARAIGVILSGMGDDGADGLRTLRAMGGVTVAQDETTSVVYGMPRAAVAAGAVEYVLALPAIGTAVRKILGLDCASPSDRKSWDGRE